MKLDIGFSKLEIPRVGPWEELAKSFEFDESGLEIIYQIFC